MLSISLLVLASVAVGVVAWQSLVAAEPLAPSKTPSTPSGQGAAREPRGVDLPREAPRADPPRKAKPPPPIQWRESRALGRPSAGRLVRGVQLPAWGRAFATWDPILRRSPNRGWRRWATDYTVRLVLGVARRFRARHPEALPMLVGDLSRRGGGDFGTRFGIVGHSTHQNGLDVDVYYPRMDRRPRAPLTPGEVDRQLSQELVDLFVAAGAERVLVGPNLRLTGPAGVVVPYPNHDNHLHARIPNASPGA